MHAEETISPELADEVDVPDEADLSRSEVILKGALAAGALYGAAMVGPFVARRWRLGRRRRRHPQLRPHPRVPRVDLL